MFTGLELSARDQNGADVLQFLEDVVLKSPDELRDQAIRTL